MAVRTEMQPLINYIRQWGRAAQDDVYDGVTYWTDEQLQNILDQHGNHAVVQMTQVMDTVYAVRLPAHIQFDLNAQVVDANSNIVTATYNPLNQEVTFAGAQTGSFNIRGYRVNIFEALALLWDMKASQRFDMNNWKAGNNRIDVRQEYDACIAQRDHYRAKTIRRFPRLSSRWSTKR